MIHTTWKDIYLPEVFLLASDFAQSNRELMWHEQALDHILISPPPAHF